MSSARALWNSRLPESLKAGAGRPDGKSRSSGDRAAPHRSRPSATAPCSSLLPTGKISRLASDETCGTLQKAAPALRLVRSWCCEPGGWSDPEPEAPPYRRQARVDRCCCGCIRPLMIDRHRPISHIRRRTRLPLRIRDETTASCGGFGAENCVVPFAVEVIGLDVDLGHFGVGDLDGFRVVVVVETAMDGEPGPGRGGADQSHDHGMGEQGFAAPVLSDEGEEAMFDAVPFAGAGRMVGDRDRQPGLIGETLQVTFPQANARAIAAAAIRGDQQPGGGGVAVAAETAPPTSDALDREGRGIVVDPDINPARVRRDVIDPVGRYLAQFGDLEVVHPHRSGSPLGRSSRPLFLKSPTNW